MNVVPLSDTLLPVCTDSGRQQAWQMRQVRCVDPAFGDWLQHVQQVVARFGRAMTVTVAQVKGSAPREVGARMLVWAEGFAGTVGGGHLELDALRRAQAWLSGAAGVSEVMLRAYPLGASLGQCCGGRVELLFEGHSRGDAWLLEAGKKVQAGQPFVTELRVRPFDLGHVTNAQNRSDPAIMRPAVQRDGSDLWLSGQRDVLDAVPADDGAQPFPGLHDLGHGWLFRDAFGSVGPQVWVYGAGHVGQALIRQLAQLPCQPIWVDDRFDAGDAGGMAHNDAGAAAGDTLASGLFQALRAPAGVTVWADDPVAAVAAAPDDAMHLVMTHSHQLDEALCAAVLQRAHAWLGLIGSATKRRRFEVRLQQRGLTAETLAAMVCPLGVAGIAGKSPQVLALSIAAQLQQIFEEQTIRRGIQ